MYLGVGKLGVLKGKNPFIEDLFFFYLTFLFIHLFIHTFMSIFEKQVLKMERERRMLKLLRSIGEVK